MQARYEVAQKKLSHKFRSSKQFCSLLSCQMLSSLSSVDSVPSGSSCPHVCMFFSLDLLTRHRPARSIRARFHGPIPRSCEARAPSCCAHSLSGTVDRLPELAIRLLDLCLVTRLSTSHSPSPSPSPFPSQLSQTPLPPWPSSPIGSMGCQMEQRN